MRKSPCQGKPCGYLGGAVGCRLCKRSRHDSGLNNVRGGICGARGSMVRWAVCAGQILEKASGLMGCGLTLGVTLAGAA